MSIMVNGRGTMPKIPNCTGRAEVRYTNLKNTNKEG